MKLRRIAQIAITVDDVDRARAFYRDTLELKQLLDAPGMAFFECDGIRLLLGLAEEPEPRGGTYLYFDVDDIDAAHRSLIERGVVFEQAPHIVHRTPESALWLAFFRDSENNLLALMSEVPAPDGS